jgi:FemAB-related protein (PEP-CTERM system-associated)
MALDGQDQVCGILPLARLRSLLFGDFLVSLPYFNYGGALASSEPAESALLDEGIRLARRLGVRHLEMRDVKPRGSGWAVRSDKVAMVLELQGSEAEQFGAFSSKLRSQIRRPLRENPQTMVGGLDLLDGFYQVFARNMRDLGTPVYGRDFFANLISGLGSSADVVVVSVAGQPAAAGILVHHGGRTEIPWASSLREWNRSGVNMLLYWEAIKRSIAQGSARFDFGRSTVDGGTYRFKAQWGAQPQALFWHYWLRDGGDVPILNPSNPKFSAAVRAWQRMPVWLASLIGPRIVRHLP